MRLASACFFAVVAARPGTPPLAADPEKVSSVELLLERRPGPTRSLLRWEEAEPARASIDRALDADRREAWGEALAAYGEASRLLQERTGPRTSPRLEVVLEKLDHERQASLRLLSLVGAGSAGRPPARAAAQSDAEHPRLEAGSLLRRKVELLIATGHPPPERLIEHARWLLFHADDERPTGSPAPAPAPADAGTVRAAALLERCALDASLGERRSARLLLARVPRAAREHLSIAGAMAACRAALGEPREAIRHLVAGFGELAPGMWRTLYLLEDWNAVRGAPAFEALFPDFVARQGSSVR